MFEFWRLKLFKPVWLLYCKFKKTWSCWKTRRRQKRKDKVYWQCVKFHASSFSHSYQYRYQIQCAQNSFSRDIMRIIIRAMCQKRSELNEQILYCRSELSKICSVVLVPSIRAKIQVPILNFLTIFTKLRPKNSDNLSVLKLLATHRLKTSKLLLPFQKIYFFPIQKKKFPVRA